MFGLSEVYRERIAGARLVSNPGCYATSVLLPLVPLLRERLIEPEGIVADARGAVSSGKSVRIAVLSDSMPQPMRAPQASSAAASASPSA